MKALACIQSLILLASVLPVEASGNQESADLDFFSADVELLSERFVAIAELVPSEHYDWRPSPEARSVSEVFTHVASSTYFHFHHLGVRIPRGSFHGHHSLEEIRDKSTVLMVLKESFEHALANLESTHDSPQNRHVMSTHLHEHLGQAIAYTRFLELTPPWSEKER